MVENSLKRIFLYLLVVLTIIACTPVRERSTLVPGSIETDTKISATVTGVPSVSTIRPNPTPLSTATNISPDLITPSAELRDPAALLSSLPITFPIMSTQVAEFFNQIAQPEDIALILSNRIGLLSSITAGEVRVGYASWAEAEKSIDRLAGSVEIIAYNPEHWHQTPAVEKENLVETVKWAAEIAHSKGLKLMVTPDRRFAQEKLGEIAAYADIVGLQGQRIQDDPQEFESWVREMVEIARASNPQVMIFVQVGTSQGSAEEMFAAIKTVADEINGISIWVAPGTMGELQSFIQMLRPPG